MRPRRIAILAPMPSELRPVVEALGLVRSNPDEPFRFRGSSNGIEVLATLTGIGMDAGARAATRILDATAPDHLVVVGIAGGIGPHVSIGDRVVPERVLNLDTGEVLEASPLGGAPRFGTLASSGRLIASVDEARRLEERGVLAIDMESAAIGGVCLRRGCPWSVFRGISDRADDGTTDASVLGLVESDGSPNLAAVARFLLTRPHRIPQLVRLARGSRTASRVAADAVARTLERIE